MPGRSRSNGSNTTCKVRVLTYNPGGYPATPVGDVTYTDDTKVAFSDKRSINDVTTPNFHKLKASGKVIMNSLTISREDYSFPTNEKVVLGPDIPGWGTRTYEGAYTAWMAVNPPDPSWFSQRMTDAKPWTLQEAYSKVAQEDFMSMVTVVEAGKTASMLRKPFGRANDLLTQIFKRKAKLIGKGLDAASAASSAWLEYRLGWKPLMYDISGIWDAWIANTEAAYKPVRLVARRSFKVEHNVPTENYTANAPFVSGVPMVRVKNLLGKVSSGVLYELKDEGLPEAQARRMGMRLSDVPASLWELVPYSFVVDRFISVGSWLNAVVPKPGVTVLGSWTTTLTDTKLTCLRLDQQMPIGDSSYTITGGVGGSHKNFNLTRVANPSTTSFGLPVWNPKTLNFNQTLDHYALIYERLRGIGLTRTR